MQTGIKRKQELTDQTQAGKKPKKATSCPEIDNATKEFKQDSWIDSQIGRDQFNKNSTELFVAMCLQLSSLPVLHTVQLTIQRTTTSRYSDETICLNAIEKLLNSAKLLDTLDIGGINLDASRLDRLRSWIKKRNSVTYFQKAVKKIKALKLAVGIISDSNIKNLLNLLDLELESLQLSGLTLTQFVQLTTKLQSDKNVKSVQFKMDGGLDENAATAFLAMLRVNMTLMNISLTFRNPVIARQFLTECLQIKDRPMFTRISINCAGAEHKSVASLSAGEKEKVVAFEEVLHRTPFVVNIPQYDSVPGDTVEANRAANQACERIAMHLRRNQILSRIIADLESCSKRRANSLIDALLVSSSNSAAKLPKRRINEKVLKKVVLLLEQTFSFDIPDLVAKKALLDGLDAVILHLCRNFLLQSDKAAELESQSLDPEKQRRIKHAFLSQARQLLVGIFDRANPEYCEICFEIGDRLYIYLNELVLPSKPVAVEGSVAQLNSAPNLGADQQVRKKRVCMEIILPYFAEARKSADEKVKAKADSLAMKTLKSGDGTLGIALKLEDLSQHDDDSRCNDFEISYIARNRMCHLLDPMPISPMSSKQKREEKRNGKDEKTADSSLRSRAMSLDDDEVPTVAEETPESSTRYLKELLDNLAAENFPLESYKLLDHIARQVTLVMNIGTHLPADQEYLQEINAFELTRGSSRMVKSASSASKEEDLGESHPGLVPLSAVAALSQPSQPLDVNFAEFENMRSPRSSARAPSLSFHLAPPFPAVPQPPIAAKSVVTASAVCGFEATLKNSI